MRFDESVKECNKIIRRLKGYGMHDVSIKYGFGDHCDLVIDNVNLISDAKIDVVHVLLHGVVNGIIAYRNVNDPYEQKIERWED